MKRTAQEAMNDLYDKMKKRQPLTRTEDLAITAEIGQAIKKAKVFEYDKAEDDNDY